MRRPFLLAGALALFGCGGGMQRELKGATFDLSSKEAGLADEYEREEPRRADAKTRCDYWTKRSEEAATSHLIGIFQYSPEHFVNLRAWTEAEKADTCGAAKAEADAKAAKKLDADRELELAEARRAHEGRDRESWAHARLDECAAARREDACDGARAYVKAVPDGVHVAEANAALRAAESKLGELRRLREEEEQRRVAATAKLEDVAGFRISGLRVTVTEAPGGVGQYLKVVFDLTALRSLARGATPIVKAACRVDDKRMVDVATALDLHVSELDPGDTKQIEASPYAKSTLSSAPSQCDLVVMKATAMDTVGAAVHSFCYVPGQKVRDGSCGP
jgi:hypothetical protein